MTHTTLFASQLLVPPNGFEYPDGPLADALEEEVARSLPHIPGLEASSTQEERMGVYARTIEAQMAQFVAAHGGPFGVPSARQDAGRASVKASASQQAPSSAKA